MSNFRQYNKGIWVSQQKATAFKNLDLSCSLKHKTSGLNGHENKLGKLTDNFQTFRAWSPSDWKKL